MLQAETALRDPWSKAAGRTAAGFPTIRRGQVSDLLLAGLVLMAAEAGRD
jgi:hypothetical protein